MLEVNGILAAVKLQVFVPPKKSFHVQLSVVRLKSVSQEKKKLSAIRTAEVLIRPTEMGLIRF